MKFSTLIGVAALAIPASCAKVTTTCDTCTGSTNSECLLLLTDYYTSLTVPEKIVVLQSMSECTDACVEDSFSDVTDFYLCMESVFEAASDKERLLGLDDYCAASSDFAYGALLLDADGCAACISKSDKVCLTMLETSVTYAESQQSKAKILHAVLEGALDDDAEVCEGDLKPAVCAEKMLVAYSQLSDKLKLVGLKSACSEGNLGNIAAAGNDQYALSPQNGKDHLLQNDFTSFAATSKSSKSASSSSSPSVSTSMSKVAMAALVVGGVVAVVGAAVGVKSLVSTQRRREYATIPAFEPI